ncbi:MAG TPA: hypothetical protein PKJ37_10835 [Acidobacteriota bacterium]|nr:hypothetical protein [Acidobacteriota bacterium]HNT18371.1 hypothetical protein [Acidobacteriota bacterium]
MDTVEQLFRKTPQNQLVLSRYIKYLIEKEHIMEAKYYHEQLTMIDPAGLENNRLGYLLSIMTMNSKVAEYEKKLISAGATKEQTYSLQLYYYYTFSDSRRMRDCAECLLDIEPTEEFTYKITLTAILKLEDFELASKFVKYYLPRIQIADKNMTALMRIVRKKLVRIFHFRSKP